MQCELSFSRSSSISSISNASTFASATSPLPSDAGGSSEPSRQACKKSLEVTYNGYEGCGWAQCMANIFGESRLYDHILKKHVNKLLRTKPDPEEQKAAARNRYRASRLNARNPADENLEASSSSGSDSEDDVYEIDDHFQCRFRGCGMRLQRGTDERKTAWLRDHLATRHFVGVRTISCLLKGCEAKFATKRQLDDHIRSSHHKVKKQSQRKSDDVPPKNRPEFTSTSGKKRKGGCKCKTSKRNRCCMTMQRINIAKMTLLEDMFDVVDSAMLERIMQYELMGYRCRTELVREKHCNGAAWRKSISPQMSRIVPWDFEKEEADKEEATRRHHLLLESIDKAAFLSTTLEDIFPSPGYQRSPPPSAKGRRVTFTEPLTISLPSLPSHTLLLSSLLEPQTAAASPVKSSENFLPAEASDDVPTNANTFTVSFASGACHSQKDVEPKTPPSQKSPVASTAV